MKTQLVGEAMYTVDAQLVGVVINSYVRRGDVGLGTLMKLFPFTFFTLYMPLLLKMRSGRATPSCGGVSQYVHKAGGHSSRVGGPVRLQLLPGDLHTNTGPIHY